MKRRNFLGNLALGGSAILSSSILSFGESIANKANNPIRGFEKILEADAVVIGSGLGGFASALSLLRNNKTVILTEETDWIGGQLTQQGVPPDEHPWIEFTGSTQMYRDFRNAIRDYYRRNYPLTDEALQNPLLNPGDGSVSKLCHEPKVALAVLNDLIAPYLSSKRLILLLNCKATHAKVRNDTIYSVTVKIETGGFYQLKAPYFVDATELGDLLPLCGAEFVTGTESKNDTEELHAPSIGNPNNVQAFTSCFAMDYVPGQNYVIEKPAEYNFWKNYVPDLTPPWPGKLLSLEYSQPSTLQPKALGFHPEGIATGDKLNLWNYRKIINKNNFKKGTYSGDITIVNWPQNDYMLGNLIGASDEDFTKHVEAAKQLSLSLLYWLQTEAPRLDGGKGWPEIRLRKDIMGTEDGLAKYPYIRESRRIKAVFTILEKHVGKENFALVSNKKSNVAAPFYDSVGIGYYHIDLHPTCGNVNYVDFPSLRFQIPLGALLPIRLKNLIPANKNIGTTHITNGCYRLHPVEWSIGESVGSLIGFALENKVTPHEIRIKNNLLEKFQDFIRSRGIETEWPDEDKLM